jgi:hypothetical protein
LSIDRIPTFCEKGQDMMMNISLSLNSLIWHQLCCRLILPFDVSDVSHNMSRYSSSFIEFKSSSPLSGIISYLTMKHGGNVSDTNIVTITASTVVNGNSTYGAKNASDLTADSYWHSSNETIHGFVMISKTCESNQHTTLSDRDVTEALMAIIQRIGLLKSRMTDRGRRRLMNIRRTAI